ncbi:MAG: hypothetical protein RLY46_1290, partial [Bacteroidota bacterium]
MIASIRKTYNESFTKESYKAFLDELNSLHKDAIDFRV